MPIKFYLTRADSKTATSIYARVIYGKNRLKFYTDESILPKYWNPKTQKARLVADIDSDTLNTRLDDLRTEIGNRINNYKTTNKVYPSPEVLKAILNREIREVDPNKSKLQTFFSFYEEFTVKSLSGSRISEKTRRATTYNTNKGYKSTLAHLKKFQKQYNRRLDFSNIDKDFYDDYVKYLERVPKLSINTIGDHIKRIKTVLHDATLRGINSNTTFEGFTVITEETDSIYLDEEEISAIMEADLSQYPHLDRVRDLFLIGCHTGLRFSDYSRITNENIKGRFIEIAKQQKTGKPVVIPVHPVVRSILKKYKGDLPKSISNQKTNKYLKEIGEKIPLLKKPESITITKGGKEVTTNCEKWEMISSHTARRSFATNAYKDGIPSITIMAITGHRSERSFLKYIKVTPQEHAEIMEAHWKKKNKLKVV